MVSSEVQRTLVKSPPELWAELSDPASLARHLGELGEIRVTRIDPEQAVEWEGEDISGTVLIKPSGWGTKVTLTATRELPESERPAAAVDPPVGLSPAASTHPALDSAETTPRMEPSADGKAPWAGAEPTTDAGAHLEPEPIEQPDPGPTLEARLEPIAPAQPDAAAQADPQPATRRGFFSRLFRRAPRDEPVARETPETIAYSEWESEPSDDVGTHEEALESSATIATVDSSLEQVEPVEPPEQVEPVEPPEPGGAAETSQVFASSAPVDIAGELREAQEVAAEQVTEVLTGVLDRLGAAHHRPFSRA